MSEKEKKEKLTMSEGEKKKAMTEIIFYKKLHGTQ